ncbi:MAG: M56 family metallopeptidase, partial [Eubacteriales bacterium]
MVHIKRLDYFTRIFAFIGLVLHWFNPFVWLAFILSEKDMEMSCDEAVMKTLQQDHQVAYAETLLAIATGKKLGFVTPLAFGEGNPKARIKNILVYKKPALWVSVGAILVVCIVMISLVSRQGEEHNDIIADNMESSENTQFIDDSIDNFKENEEQELTESETEVAEQLNQVEADHQALLEQQNMMEEQQSLTHDKIAPNAQTFGNKSVYEELDCVKVIVKQQKEDVTSDGIKDYIETSFYVPGEDMKVLDLENINVDALSDDGHACFVAVYDGVDTVDWNHLGTLLWEHDFHMSHAGNGQISLVAYENQENPTPVESIAGVSGQETHENNLYTALLYTNIWFGQGNYDFYCQVFTLEADGTQNMLLEQHLEIATDENFHSAEYVDILMNEEKEEMITFQNAMYGWYDSAKAIVITDIMLENQMVSTDEKEYLAYPYYDAIFRYYLNDMEDMNMAYHTEITL